MCGVAHISGHVAMLDSPEFAPAPPRHAHPIFAAAPDSVNFRKLSKRIIRQTAEAMNLYAMAPDDASARWLVCLSGGKDSYTLLAALLALKARGALAPALLACNLDQGQPGFPKNVLPDYLSRIGVAHRIEYRDTYSTVIARTQPGETLCTLCSRLRRGNLYRIAREEGCSAIVLGHHRDDLLETFFLNLFYRGRLESMAPKLCNEAGDLLVLRPLAHVAEADILRFARSMDFPIIPCTLCGSQDGLERKRVKAMLDAWEKEHPGRREIMFRALMNVRAGQLPDPQLFDFARLAAVPPQPWADSD